jgi:anaphase-promoting complex subunit 1
MALGLCGHLTKLSKLDAFEYLMKGSEPISIGLLLGIASTYVGTMNVLVTKKLATQLEALLPPSATELPLSPNTQVAALAGLGLVYANTGHRHMVEVCLRELARPPGPELENCADRESYSLTAGLALGFITMGLGEQLTVGGGLADLNLPDLLHNYMVGGPRPPTHSRPTGI